GGQGALGQRSASPDRSERNVEIRWAGWGRWGGWVRYLAGRARRGCRNRDRLRVFLRDGGAVYGGDRYRSEQRHDGQRSARRRRAQFRAAAVFLRHLDDVRNVDVRCPPVASDCVAGSADRGDGRGLQSL